MSSADLAKVWVVIPAAGVGKRMQTDTPKQYLQINHKTILEHTIDCFTSHSRVEGIVIALHTDDPYWKGLKIDVSPMPLYTVEGGAERSDSVLQALNYLEIVERLSDDSWVMVHDAARPMLCEEDIDKLLSIIDNDNAIGGILASPVRDTMKRSRSTSMGQDTIIKTESRDNLWHALTPQLFKLGELSEAIKICYEKGIPITDESSAMEEMGVCPVLVEGSSNNIKITQPADFELVKLMMSNDGYQ